jgi:hypothetical protein
MTTAAKHFDVGGHIIFLVPINMVNMNVRAVFGVLAAVVTGVVSKPFELFGNGRPVANILGLAATPKRASFCKERSLSSVGRVGGFQAELLSKVPNVLFGYTTFVSNFLRSSAKYLYLSSKPIFVLVVHVNGLLVDIISHNGTMGK